MTEYKIKKRKGEKVDVDLYFERKKERKLIN